MWRVRVHWPSSELGATKEPPESDAGDDQDEAAAASSCSSSSSSAPWWPSSVPLVLVLAARVCAAREELEGASDGEPLMGSGRKTGEPPSLIATAPSEVMSAGCVPGSDAPPPAPVALPPLPLPPPEEGCGLMQPKLMTTLMGSPSRTVGTKMVTTVTPGAEALDAAAAEAAAADAGDAAVEEVEAALEVRRTSWSRTDEDEDEEEEEVVVTDAELLRIPLPLLLPPRALPPSLLASVCAW
jgi:hypothetical protein